MLQIPNHQGGVILNQLLAEAAHCCSLLHKEGPSGAAREASPDVEGFDWARPTVSIGGASSPSSSPLSSPSSFTSPSHSHSSVTAARAAAADEGASSSPEPRALCGGRPSVEFPPRLVDPGHLMLCFLSSIREIHYCDAGLHCRGAFMTDPRVTEELKLLADRLRVTVHGSPRQLRDPTRPWVTKEVRTSLTLSLGRAFRGFLQFVLLFLLLEVADAISTVAIRCIAMWEMLMHFQVPFGSIDCVVWCRLRHLLIFSPKPASKQG